jgi:uncharacterized protein YggE
MKVAVRLFIISALVISASMVAGAQDKQEPRLITVTGQAEVNVAPDEVVFDLTVQTINKDLRTAKSQTDDRLRKVIELTRKYKVQAKDVQTDYIKLEPRYRGNDESRLFIGYSVRKDLVFTLRDVTQAEELLSELIEAGVSRLNGIRFQTSELRRYRDQARAMAIKAAQEKAIALTAQIGQKIGKAYSIDEEAPAPRISAMYNAQANFSTASEESTDSQGTLALGQIKISATITVKFELN